MDLRVISKREPYPEETLERASRQYETSVPTGIAHETLTDC